MDVYQLSLEIHAEMWMYKFYREVCKNHIENFREMDNNTSIEMQSIDHNRIEFYYNIPRLIFSLVWRKMLINNINYEFVDEYSDELETLSDLVQNIRNNLTPDKIDIQNYIQRIQETVQYREENYEAFTEICEELYSEFLEGSIEFFQTECNRGIVRTHYNLGQR